MTEFTERMEKLTGAKWTDVDDPVFDEEEKPMTDNELNDEEWADAVAVEGDIQLYGGVLCYIAPVLYTFTPQPDITAYELALCVPIMQFGTAHENHVLELPKSAQRHFVKQG